MTFRMENLKIELEEQLLIKYSDKAFDIAKNLKNDGYQRSLTSMIYKFFDKITSSSGIKNENLSNKELAAELQKPIIRKS